VWAYQSRALKLFIIIILKGKRPVICMGKLKGVGLKIHFPTHFQSKTLNQHNKNLHKSFTSPKITQKIKKYLKRT
jgi:hypothetical protein